MKKFSIALGLATILSILSAFAYKFYDENSNRRIEMQLTTKFIGLIAVATMLVFIPLGTADEVTDDTGVFDGLNQVENAYTAARRGY